MNPEFFILYESGGKEIMPQVEQIISSIEMLTGQEFNKLRDWILERDWEKWDKQLENDSENGNLDFLFNEAMAEKRKGILREL